MSSTVHHDTAELASYGTAWLARVQLSTGSTMQHGMAWHRQHNVAQHGMAWHGTAVKVQCCAGKSAQHRQRDAAQHGMAGMVQHSAVQDGAVVHRVAVACATWG